MTPDKLREKREAKKNALKATKPSTAGGAGAKRIAQRKAQSEKIAARAKEREKLQAEREKAKKERIAKSKEKASRRGTGVGSKSRSAGTGKHDTSGTKKTTTKSSSKKRLSGMQGKRGILASKERQKRLFGK